MSNIYIYIYTKEKIREIRLICFLTHNIILGIQHIIFPH